MSRLRDVPRDQPEGHKHVRVRMLRQDRYSGSCPRSITLADTPLVKIWSLGSSTPNFQLEAHETKGVNHVDYYPHSDKPYLLTTSDDVSWPVSPP